MDDGKRHLPMRPSTPLKPCALGLLRSEAGDVRLVLLEDATETALPSQVPT